MKNLSGLFNNEHLSLPKFVFQTPGLSIIYNKIHSFVLRSGQLLESGTELRGLELSSDGRHINIPASQRDHEGIYVCVATNKAGTLDIDVELQVLGNYKSHSKHDKIYA